jgi:hypothetical protein
VLVLLPLVLWHLLLLLLADLLGSDVGSLLN